MLALTGAPDALVVNNNAAALLLVLAAIAPRKEVLVSRGELIEIGGEFRLPDIMAASGAKLVEVGTTNRTRIGDYRRAMGSKTSLILKVHPSNYRVVGFTNAVPVADLVALGAPAGVPVAFDVGSGLLDRYPEVPADEPAVTQALADGADLVTFSADKLLGGPQAGVIVGRTDLIERLRRQRDDARRFPSGGCSRRSRPRCWIALEAWRRRSGRRPPVPAQRPPAAARSRATRSRPPSW